MTARLLVHDDVDDVDDDEVEVCFVVETTAVADPRVVATLGPAMSVVVGPDIDTLLGVLVVGAPVGFEVVVVVVVVDEARMATEEEAGVLAEAMLAADVGGVGGMKGNRAARLASATSCPMVSSACALTVEFNEMRATVTSRTVRFKVASIAVWSASSLSRPSTVFLTSMPLARMLLPSPEARITSPFSVMPSQPCGCRGATRTRSVHVSSRMNSKPRAMFDMC